MNKNEFKSIFVGTEKKLEKIGEVRGMDVVIYDKDQQERYKRLATVGLKDSKKLNKMPIVKWNGSIDEHDSAPIFNKDKYHQKNERIAKLAEEASKVKPSGKVEKVFCGDIENRGIDNAYKYACRLDRIILYLSDFLSGGKGNVIELWDVKNDKLTDLQLMVKVNNIAMREYRREQKENTKLIKYSEEKSVLDILEHDSRTRGGKKFLKDASKRMKCFVKTSSKRIERRKGEKIS